MKVRAVEYSRASTDQQTNSVEDQRQAIAQWAEENGREIVQRFPDDGVSGVSAEKRPEFLRMIQLVDSGQHEFEEILCYSLDRFGRFSSKADFFYYFGLLERAGVRLFFIKNPEINLDDLAGCLHLLVQSEKATEFSRNQSDVVLRGSITNAKQGNSSGGVAPYGFDRVVVDENGSFLQILPAGSRKAVKKHRVKLAPGDPSKVMTVQRLFDLFGNERFGLKRICRTLTEDGILSPTGKQWRTATIRSMLTNVAYLGTRSYCRTKRGHFQNGGKWAMRDPSERVEKSDAHPALIDPDLFERVQVILEQTSKIYRERAAAASLRTGNYLLTPRLRCRQCGKSFQSRTHKNGSGKVYRRYVDAGHEVGSGVNCSRYPIDADQLDSAVIKVMADTIAPGLSISRLKRNILSELKLRNHSQVDRRESLDHQIVEVNTKIDRIKQAIMAGVPGDTFVEDLTDLRQEKQRLEESRAKVQTTRKQARNLEILAEQILGQMQDFRSVLKSRDRLALKKFLHRVIDRVEIDKDSQTAFLYAARLPAVADPITALEESVCVSKSDRPPAMTFLISLPG